MLDKVLTLLIDSRNAAADDVLLEALELGDSVERARALAGLIARHTQIGVYGMLLRLESMTPDLRMTFVQRISGLLTHIASAGHAKDPALRRAAILVISMARVGKLASVLAENLHNADERVAASAAEAIVSLARHVTLETRNLQSGKLPLADLKQAFARLLDLRGDLEPLVFRALDKHRGTHAPELLRAALMLADSPISKTTAVLSTSRHGGVSPMVKRVQQTPDSEHVEAFLLGATHGQLRSQFPIAFAQIETPPALDALIRRTYLLKDHRLRSCMSLVGRGTWWNEATLDRDLPRHAPAAAGMIGSWIAASGCHDVVQDEKLLKIYDASKSDFQARLRLLRITMARPRGASLTLLRRFIDDPDESLQRMATREFVRRKPLDYSTVLLGLMKTAPAGVRRVAGRAISAGAFDNFYDRFEKLDPATRQRAGRAVFKLLPDAVTRLGRRLRTGDIEQRIKALSITRELDLSRTLMQQIVELTAHESPRVRSKAILVAGGLKADIPTGLLEKALADPDPRVRANAIEVAEAEQRSDLLPTLARSVSSTTGRERANAIKALHSMKVQAAAAQLMKMLRDPRAEHRVSGLWAARESGIYDVLREVVRVAQTETEPRVRRYAQASARHVAGHLTEFRPIIGGGSAGRKAV